MNKYVFGFLLAMLVACSGEDTTEQESVDLVVMPDSVSVTDSAGLVTVRQDTVAANAETADLTLTWIGYSKYDNLEDAELVAEKEVTANTTNIMVLLDPKLFDPIGLSSMDNEQYIDGMHSRLMALVECPRISLTAGSLCT